MISFAREPRGAIYIQLLWFLQARSAQFSLVWRDQDDAQELELALQPFLRLQRQQSEWPGTTLVEHTALVRHYSASLEAVSVLRRVDGLYHWLAPEAPEDLAFYTADGRVVLGSIAHEQDGWLDLPDLQSQDSQHLLRTLRSAGVIAA